MYDFFYVPEIRKVFCQHCHHQQQQPIGWLWYRWIIFYCILHFQIFSQIHKMQWMSEDLIPLLLVSTSVNHGLHIWRTIENHDFISKPPTTHHIIGINMITQKAPPGLLSNMRHKTFQVPGPKVKVIASETVMIKVILWNFYFWSNFQSQIN